MTANTYDPNDKTQAAFLAAIAKGESGGSSNVNLGYGGVDLSGYATGPTGFPIWAGTTTSAGPTHAAGIYQFEPATWNTEANALGLNFQSASDQNEAAWNLASQTYAAKTGGSLEAALTSGDYTQVASALHSTWTSLSGTEISDALGSGATAPAGGTTATSGSTSTPATSVSLGDVLTGKASLAQYIASASGISSLFGAVDAAVKNLAIRGGAMALALVLIAFGLYYLADRASDGGLSNGVKTAGEAALAA